MSLTAQVAGGGGSEAAGLVVSLHGAVVALLARVARRLLACHTSEWGALDAVAEAAGRGGGQGVVGG